MDTHKYPVIDYYTYTMHHNLISIPTIIATKLLKTCHPTIFSSSIL